MEQSYFLHIVKTRWMQFCNYTYLGIDKKLKKAFVIDPSWDISEILTILDKYGAKLEKILLTHSHFDHTNMVNKLVSKFNSEVYISKKEAEYYGYKNRNLKYIEDLDTIKVGDTEIKCIITPGHTKGSTCFLSSGNIFTGDTVFIEGCGICKIDGGSAEDMYYSINRLIRMIPLDTYVYPGHSFGKAPGKTMEYLYEKNIYFQIDNVECFVKYRNRKNNKRLFDFK